MGATSGDTGAAAVHAFAGKGQIRIAMLHPEGRVSPVQRRQMTTVHAPNVLNVALRGTFDDCQDLVKAMFADAPFRRELRLSAVNSINWARVVAQSVYYVWAALRLGAPDRAVAFAVPTGNFGNVYAGRVAAAIGLPVARLVVATNENDILARFFATRSYERGTVVATTSPSMDIQVASNFERLLLELEGSDAERTRARMQAFAQAGGFTLEGEVPRLSPAEAPIRLRSPPPSPPRCAARASWSIRTPPSAWPSRPVIDRLRACPWSRWRPPTRPSFPKRSKPRPVSRRRCRRATPT